MESIFNLCVGLTFVVYNHADTFFTLSTRLSDKYDELH